MNFIKKNKLLIVLFVLMYKVIAATPLQNVTRKFDDNFKERYTTDYYNYEVGQAVNSKNKSSKTYNDDIAYKEGQVKIKEENRRFNFSLDTGILSWFFYTVLALALIYLVYVLKKEGSHSIFNNNTSKTLNTEEEITADNIKSTDIRTLIKNAEINKDFRLAIRYNYLLTLKTLNTKQHIKFEDDKTNTQYLNEINDKPFKEEFAYLQYLYNYIWYGKFSINTVQYNKAKSYFTALLKTV